MAPTRPPPHMHTSVPTSAPPFAQFPSRRSVVYSTQGMIACSQPLASAAGLEILKKGGNAADAAVAVSAVLGLTEPTSCGIGGDAFCLYFDAKTNKVSALNGSGRSPRALTLEKTRELGIQGKEIGLLDINAATVPGCAAAWCDTIDILGSGKVTIADALAPAIRMAEAGVPISEITSHHWCSATSKLLSVSPAGKEMLVLNPADGTYHGPGPGEVFVNKGLGRTLRKVAEQGKKGFYEGETADAIVALMKAQGGVMTHEDLSTHTTTPVDPIHYSYGGPKGVTLHECPPNGQGITALIALGIIEALEEAGTVDFSSMKHNGVQYLHTLIECIRLAFADVRAYVADPEMAKVPVQELLSKPYLKSRSLLFNPLKVIPNLRRGTPFASSDTVLFTTSDSEGNACSYIQSNYAGFGTHAVPEGCGFTLQNRGCNFALEEGHPNCIEGGKRPYHTIIPAMVTRGSELGGELFMTYGVMGGFMQPQGHVQVLMNMLHHGLNAQTALDAPRFCIGAGMPDNAESQSAAVPDSEDGGDISSECFLEEGISEEVRDGLREMGHVVEIIKGYGRGLFGKGQIIQKLSGGVWAGGSDMRGDGQAVPEI